MNNTCKKWRKVAQLLSVGGRSVLHPPYSIPPIACRRYIIDYPRPVYELRRYRIQPSEYKTNFGLFKDYINLRKKHSKLVGFWMVEIGENLMQLVHIWEYEEGIAQRYRVRKSMITDAPWQTEFVPNFLETVRVMTNSLMILAPDSKLTVDFPSDTLTRSKKVVYELQTMKRSDQANDIKSTEDVTLVGRFFGVLGPTDTEYRLWRYDDIRTASNVLCNRVKDRPVQGTSLLLYPAKFSPLQ